MLTMDATNIVNSPFYILLVDIKKKKKSFFSLFPGLCRDNNLLSNLNLNNVCNGQNNNPRPDTIIVPISITQTKHSLHTMEKLI